MNFKQTIRQNAILIRELRARIGATAEFREKGEKQLAAWLDACSEFNGNYSRLAFIGGVESARERLRSGDSEAIEYALDFLETRPYFFRSGYMYKDFMRVLRSCPLSSGQRQRHVDIHARYMAHLSQFR